MEHLKGKPVDFEVTLNKIDLSISKVTLPVIDIAADGYLFDADANEASEATVVK